MDRYEHRRLVLPQHLLRTAHNLVVADMRRADVDRILHSADNGNGWRGDHAAVQAVAEHIRDAERRMAEAEAQTRQPRGSGAAILLLTAGCALAVGMIVSAIMFSSGPTP